MNTRERLDSYLSDLRQRLHWAVYSRAGAAVSLCVLLILSGTIAWLAPLGFPDSGVWLARALLAIVLTGGVLALWWPLKRLRERAGAEIERHLPTQDGRIATFIDASERARAGASVPLLDLLAEDALARQMPLQLVVSSRRLWIANGVAVVAVGVLAYLLLFGRAQWGYGSRHVLLGTQLPPEAVPVQQLAVQPGNTTIRRNADLLLQAKPQGFKPHAMQLYVRFIESGSDNEVSETWERAPMQMQSGKRDDGYRLTLYAVRARLQYYAEADGIRSPTYTVKVVDVPHIESMQVQYRYPGWTGLPSLTQRTQRDVRAVADTQVRIDVQADAPLEEPRLVLDQEQVAMSIVGKAGDATAKDATGKFTVRRPGRYHISAQVAGEWVAVTDDYDIAVIPDRPPTVEIVKPGRDWRASSIEEVPIVIRAHDDFRVQQLAVRYAVNGGAWREFKLPSGRPQIDARTLLQLESLGGDTPLVPGDLITYYAVGRDRHQDVQTDLFMVQVQPFERRFTEGQGGGGGGGGAGGSEQQQIAERQRDILVATWNLQRAREQQRRTLQQIKDSAQMLGDLQDKLAAQTATLVERTRARTRGNEDTRVKQFLDNLSAAVKAMTPAAVQLNAIKLQEAVPGEQTALQMLLRAESAFRDIQVTRQQNARNGGNARAGRDISELYELEMDLSRNKYETEKDIDPQQSTANPELDDALAKLKELAERQEKLAQRSHQEQAAKADRWRQEQLRREAEALRRQLQELARQQSAAQSDSPNGATGQASEQLSSTLNAMEDALQAMRKAEHSTGADVDAADRAGRSLRDAVQSTEQAAQQPAVSTSIQQLADRAKDIAQAQREVAAEVYGAVARARGNDDPLRTRRDGLTADQIQKWVQEKQKLLEQVGQLENRLREQAQSQRRAVPKTAKRLSEIAEELSGSNPQARLSRSIVDLQRGRADRMAMGEGMITEALQNTAIDLRGAARMAEQETAHQAQNADPQALLAQLGELRRALQTAQRAERAQANTQANSEGNAQNDMQSAADRSGNTTATPGGDLRSASTTRQRLGDGERARLSAAVARELDTIQARVGGGALSQADLRALRAVLPQVHRLAGDLSFGASDVQRDLLQRVQRLELQALAAAEKARQRVQVRAGSADSNAASDGDVVAEYYRRLAK